MSAAENLGPSGPRAVVHRDGHHRGAHLAARSMLMASGFLRQVFEVFERYDTPVDLIATSEVSISVTLDDVRAPGRRSRRTSAQLGEVRILREMRDREPWSAAASSATRAWRGASSTRWPDVNVVMISFAASDVNISVVVEEADVEHAVHGLHREFFSDPSPRGEG